MLDVKFVQTPEYSVNMLSKHAPEFLQQLQEKYPAGFPVINFNLGYWSKQCEAEFPKAFKIFPLAKERGANIFGFFVGLKLFMAENLLAAEFRSYRLLKSLCDSCDQIENINYALEYASQLGLYYGPAVGDIYEMKIYLKFNQTEKAVDAYQRALGFNWLDDYYQPIRNYDTSIKDLTPEEEALLSSKVPSSFVFN